MSNMSYCRFSNTLSDLKDCKHALDEEGLDSLSEGEREAAEKLIRVCSKIASFYDEKDED